MEQPDHWWRRPTLLGAMACACVGLLILLLGPALRTAIAPQEAPVLRSPPVDLLAPRSEAPDAPALPAVEPDPAPPAHAVVYISGAVVRPDVYRLPADARVKDVVLAAGGLSPEAAGEQINLAAPIADAQHIHVPRVGEPVVPPSAAGGSDPAVAADGLIDLNSASAADLEDLPGIGATLAERILAYRDAQGHFASVEDLRKVSGIGAKLFERIAPLVTVRDQ